MFDVRYPTLATSPNMGYGWDLLEAPQSYPIKPGKKESGSQSPELHGRMLRP
jgi:hypothetical protein